MIKIKPYKQMRTWDCGPAVAHMILNFYHIRPKYSDIIKRVKCTPEGGTSPEDLAKGLRKYRLSAAYSMFSEMKKIEEEVCSGRPVLVAWYSPYTLGSHWSIIKGITSSRNLHLIDPAAGRVRLLSASDFAKVWFTIDPEAEKNYVVKHPLSSVRWREAIFVSES